MKDQELCNSLILGAFILIASCFTTAVMATAAGYPGSIIMFAIVLYAVSIFKGGKNEFNDQAIFGIGGIICQTFLTFIVMI